MSLNKLNQLAVYQNLMTKTAIYITAILIIIACAAFSQDKKSVRYVSGIKVVDYNGLQPLLEKSNDTTYIINFWATWCAPCIKELPYFQQINDKFAGARVKVILVSLDFERQIESRLIPFIKKNSVTPEVIVLNDPDANNWIDKIDPSWSGALPATLFFNKNGRKFYEKEFTYDEIRNVIFELNPQLR